MAIHDAKIDIVLIHGAASILEPLVTSRSLEVSELGIRLYRHDAPTRLAEQCADRQIIRSSRANIDENSRWLALEELGQHLLIDVQFGPILYHMLS